MQFDHFNIFIGNIYIEYWERICLWLFFWASFSAISYHNKSLTWVVSSENIRDYQTHLANNNFKKKSSVNTDKMYLLTTWTAVRT